MNIFFDTNVSDPWMEVSVLKGEIPLYSKGI